MPWQPLEEMWNHCFHKIEDFKRIIPSLNCDFIIDFTDMPVCTHTQFGLFTLEIHTSMQSDQF